MKEVSSQDSSIDTPAGVRVAIIDDERSIVDALGQLLSSEGYDVSVYDDPQKACRDFESQRFDVVLADLKMPVMDGLEVLKRARDVREDTSVILFTGHATVESAIEALNQGAVDYLIKPVNISRLRTALTRARNRHDSLKKGEGSLSELESFNQRLSQHLRELNALYEASRSLSSTADIPALLDSILALAAGVTHATVGSVMLVDKSGEYLRIAASEGMKEVATEDVRQPIGESISGFVAQSGEPLLIQNVEEDSRFKRRNRERYGDASLICVPLIAHTRTLGVINLARKRDGGAFDDHDLKLLTMFASQAAIAIDDARQFADKSRQLAEFSALHEISGRMASVSTQEEMLELVFDSLSKIIPLEYCFWMRHNPNSQSLRVIGAMGREFEFTSSGKISLEDRTVDEPIIRGVIQEELNSAGPAQLSSYIIDRLTELTVIDLRDDAFMSVPVYRDGQPTYIFCLGTSYIVSYSDHERSLAEIVISQAAVLYEKEKALLNASRLLTMGNMISEISHDLRKPLTTIKGSVGLLRKKIKEKEDCNDLLRMLEEESHRLNELVSELVDFSRPHRYETEKTDLRRLVFRALELVAPDLEKRNIASDFDFAEVNWEVIINKNQVFEVLLNLLMNAVEAMENGGGLTISGGLGRPEYKSEDYLTLSITDTGCGVNKAAMSQLFDRYYTNKEHGTGLGLAVVERIMSSHNGVVTVESAEGVGSTFTLYFPLSH